MEMEEYQSKGMSGGDKYRKWLTGRADSVSWCATWVSYVLVTRVGLSESSFHKTGYVRKCTMISETGSR